jgi:hypothetical protein
MDEPHMLNALRDWQWSSVRAHPGRRDDALVKPRPVLAIVRRLGDLLDISPGEQAELAGFESPGAHGRPPGDAAFPAFAERNLGRSPRKGKPGPKPKAAGH